MPKPDTIHEKEKEALSVNLTLSQNRSHAATDKRRAQKKPEQYTKKKEKWPKQVVDAADINTFTWEHEIVMNNTEQKKAKEELENIVLERTSELLRLNTELEKSNHELEQFAYIASHDLQEPLRKIQAFVDLVKNHMNDKVIAERYFNKINLSAQRMSMLINDVLNYSRLTKTGEQFVTTDLNKILKQVLCDFELLIEQKQAVITYDKLPVVKGIPLQLSQLFSNLISNSLKFAEINPVISVTSRVLPMAEVKKHSLLHAGNTYLELVFKDNGIGFEQQYAEQIFIIFHRLNNQRAYSGTGIGLALCKKIVEHHDGIITAHSKQGKGAAFTIILPIKHRFGRSTHY